jgi:hypothetical protein
MTHIDEMPTAEICFEPRNLDRDDTEPTMPPHGPSERVVDELIHELEAARGDWLRFLVGVYGDATKVNR